MSKIVVGLVIILALLVALPGCSGTEEKSGQEVCQHLREVGGSSGYCEGIEEEEFEEGWERAERQEQRERE